MDGWVDGLLSTGSNDAFCAQRHHQTETHNFKHHICDCIICVIVMPRLMIEFHLTMKVHNPPIYPENFTLFCLAQIKKAFIYPGSTTRRTKEK